MLFFAGRDAVCPPKFAPPLHNTHDAASACFYLIPYVDFLLWVKKTRMSGCRCRRFGYLRSSWKTPRRSWLARMCTNAAALPRGPCIRSFFDSNLRVGLSASGNPLILQALGGRAVGCIG